MKGKICWAYTDKAYLVKKQCKWDKNNLLHNAVVYLLSS